jgi:hypothetical protein
MTGSRNMTVDPSTHVLFLAGAVFEPAPPAAAGTRSRPKMVPGSFVLLTVERR